MPSQKRLRVALVSYSFGEYSVQLANGLAKHAEVFLLLPEQAVESHLAKLGSGVRLFSFLEPRLRQPVQQLGVIRRLIREIRQFSPDVVHYQGAHLWFDLALPLFHHYPLVLTIHDFKRHPGDRLSAKTPFWVEKFARRCAHQL